MADLTIDLATLNVMKNGSKVPQEPDLESLGSEDEGPPDFTLNMEKWMRGTEKWKKEGGQIENDREDDEGQLSGGKGSEGGESVEEEKRKDMEDLDSDFLPLSASTPAPNAASKENVPERSHPSDMRNVTHRPWSRLNARAVQTTTSDEVSNQIRDLQIKIEQLQMADGKHQLVKDSLQLENSTLRDEIDGLRDELSSMRSTVSKMRQQAKVTDQERELERKSQEEAKSKVSSSQNKFEPLLQELAIARSTAEAEKRHSEAKITALEAKFLSTQESLMKQQIDSRYAQEVKNAENLKLRSELDICKGEAKAYQQTLQTREEDHTAAIAVLHKKLDAGHEAQSRADVLKMELDHALEQLAETRRIVDTVEDENDRLTQENERQRDELNATTTILGGKDAAIAAAKSTIDDLRDEISRIKGEKNIGLIGEDVHDAEIKQLRQQHRAELRAAQVVHEQKQKDLNATISRAQDGMRRQGARLQKTHREELASLKQEIVTLKSRLNKAPADPPAATVAEYRNAIRMLSTKLNVANETILSTRHTLAEAHKSLAVSMSDVNRLNKQFDAFKTAVKKHYHDRLQQQDLEWRKKMNAVLKDREVIVKQLFIMWGREEMGIAPEGEKQPYRYKFFKKNGERIPQPGELDKNGNRIPLPGEKDKNEECVTQPGEKDKKEERIPQRGEKDKQEQRTVRIAENDKRGEQASMTVEKQNDGKRVQSSALSEKNQKQEAQIQSAADAAAAAEAAKNDRLIRKITEKHQNEQRLQSAAENAKHDRLVRKILEKHQKQEKMQTATENAKNDHLIQKILAKHQQQEQIQSATAADTETAKNNITLARKPTEKQQHHSKSNPAAVLQNATNEALICKMAAKQKHKERLLELRDKLDKIQASYKPIPDLQIDERMMRLIREMEERKGVEGVEGRAGQEGVVGLGRKQKGSAEV